VPKPKAAKVEAPAPAPDAELDVYLAAVEALAQQLAETIAALPLEQKVEALNRARTILHEVSPFKREPVDLVLWVKGSAVFGNDYNPNAVAPPEMKLLEISIDEDGMTQPIVANPLDGGDEVVDGFHRNRVCSEVESIRTRLHGYLPVSRIKADRSGRRDRIASTIRHNRARGKHRVGSMSEIVRMLYVAGWKDDKIAHELGMGADEVLRLKQTTGVAALFADQPYSEAWEPEIQTGNKDSVRRRPEGR
jgi:ParB-like chromosome segregation protein Spo0J